MIGEGQIYKGPRIGAVGYQHDMLFTTYLEFVISILIAPTLHARSCLTHPPPLLMAELKSCNTPSARHHLEQLWETEQRERGGEVGREEVTKASNP